MSGTVCDERNRATSQSLVSCSHIPIRGKMSSTPSPTPFLLTYSGPSSWHTYIQPANSFYLPHLKGAGIENFKVRNRGGYSCHLRDSMVCSLSSSSLLVCSSLLPLSADRHSLLQCVHGVQCCPSPRPHLTSQVQCPNPNRVTSLRAFTPRLPLESACFSLLSSGSGSPTHIHSRVSWDA